MDKQLRYEERPDLGAYVHPHAVHGLPIYNWFVYPHSFAPMLVWELLERFNIVGSESRIYDPFVGAGTTILAAQERGISAVGLDLLPISVMLTTAKVTPYHIAELQSDYECLQWLLEQPDQTKVNENDPLFVMAQAPKSIIARAFTKQTLREIVALKTAITCAATNENHMIFFIVALLAVLEECSFTLKAGGWLKIQDTPVNVKPITKVFIQRVASMLSDISNKDRSSMSGEWQVKVGDARLPHHDIGMFDAIITSPPYPNRHDYSRVLCLELLVGCLNEYSEIATLRHTLLRSHVEGRPPNYELPAYEPPVTLETILQTIEKNGAENRLLRMLRGYFEDMSAVLHSLRQSVTSGGYIAFVVGNVRFTGIHVPVDDILGEIGQSVGLNWETTLIARRRNNSAQQMRDFGRDPARESIVIWRT